MNSRAGTSELAMWFAAKRAKRGAATLVPFIRTNDPLLVPALITPSRTRLSSPKAVTSGAVRAGLLGLFGVIVGDPDDE